MALYMYIPALYFNSLCSSLWASSLSCRFNLIDFSLVSGIS
jgi:hypothetical protein